MEERDRWRDVFAWILAGCSLAVIGVATYLLSDIQYLIAP